MSIRTHTPKIGSRTVLRLGLHSLSDTVRCTVRLRVSLSSIPCVLLRYVTACIVPGTELTKGPGTIRYSAVLRQVYDLRYVS